jgi:transposase-like protein
MALLTERDTQYRCSNESGIPRYFLEPNSAREYLERLRRPDEIPCPHCGDADRTTALRPREGSRRPARPGLWKCLACRKQFTVTVGTVFEGSHVPLHKWLRAIYERFVRRARATDLGRILGVNARTARRMTARLGGIVPGSYVESVQACLSACPRTPRRTN